MNNSEGGNLQKAGAVAFGGHNNAAPANFTTDGQGPLTDDEDGWVQLTEKGRQMAADIMAKSIVRIQGELEEAQAHIAVYEAERSILLRERDEARKQLRVAVGLLSTTPKFQDQHPEEVLKFVEEAAK